VSPFTDAGGDVVADFEHDERDAAFVQVSGGSEADRSGSDHGDRKGGWVHGCVSSQLWFVAG
jgi:hypothetical protein